MARWCRKYTAFLTAVLCCLAAAPVGAWFDMYLGSVRAAGMSWAGLAVPDRGDNSPLFLNLASGGWISSGGFELSARRWDFSEEAGESEQVLHLATARLWSGNERFFGLLQGGGLRFDMGPSLEVQYRLYRAGLGYHPRESRSAFAVGAAGWEQEFRFGDRIRLGPEVSAVFGFLHRFNDILSLGLVYETGSSDSHKIVTGEGEEELLVSTYQEKFGIGITYSLHSYPTVLLSVDYLNRTQSELHWQELGRQETDIYPKQEVVAMGFEIGWQLPRARYGHLRGGVNFHQWDLLDEQIFSLGFGIDLTRHLQLDAFYQYDLWSSGDPDLEVGGPSDRVRMYGLQVGVSW